MNARKTARRSVRAGTRATRARVDLLDRRQGAHRAPRSRSLVKGKRMVRSIPQRSSRPLRLTLGRQALACLRVALDRERLVFPRGRVVEADVSTRVDPERRQRLAVVATTEKIVA